MGEGVEQEQFDLGTTDLDKISLKSFYGNWIKNFSCENIFCLTQYDKGFNPEGECHQLLYAVIQCGEDTWRIDEVWDWGAKVESCNPSKTRKWVSDNEVQTQKYQVTVDFGFQSGLSAPGAAPLLWHIAFLHFTKSRP